ncbi:MATE family efflux transporter [Vibrio hippocampi]|uniref:Multidrug resistance protein NorM n=1 Tax=Vibrio hippocampi TaxID=654686 RepID=A0ABM8ZEW0_9VIBR|nr:MATE family efflux transporter [Vibrio hippocampi]CAH0524441.1 Multidrug export protein MepA [Vibrio hippocampi]
MHDKHGLLSAPIALVLRQMTVPMVFGMIAILAFNLVDTFFISLLGTDALAAVSFTFPVTFSVNCITMGIGIGLSTNIGRSLGEHDIDTAKRLTTHGLMLAVTLVLVASVIGLLTISPLFTLLGADQTTLPLIQQYMQVWYLAVPLLVVPMAGNSAIRATGDTKTPAKIMMLSGLINGILDPLLIFGIGPFPEMGIQGAALASGVAWSIALVFSLYILAKREQLLGLFSVLKIIGDWGAILKIGLPSALSSAMAPISGAILMKLLSVHGTIAVAAFGAAQRVEAVLILVLISLSSALTPFMAQNFGAKNRNRSFSALFLSMRFSVLFQLLVFVMMVPLSHPISLMFSQEQAVRDILWLYLITVPLSYGCLGIMMMLGSGLNALHQPSKAFLWSLLRLFVFTLPAAFVGGHFYGIQGIFIGVTGGNIAGGVMAYLYAKKLSKHLLSKHL